jgi:hypothetical protein
MLSTITFTLYFILPPRYIYTLRTQYITVTLHLPIITTIYVYQGQHPNLT